MNPSEKLRMIGVPIDGPATSFYDNQSVVTKGTLPHFTLNKKYNAITHHTVRESVASKAIRITHEKGQRNLSDVLTKFL